MNLQDSSNELNNKTKNNDTKRYSYLSLNIRKTGYNTWRIYLYFNGKLKEATRLPDDVKIK